MAIESEAAECLKRRRVVVSGSRGIRDAVVAAPILSDHIDPCDTVIVGGAAGIDFLTEAWARSRDIAVEVREADWNKHGKAAGPIRNREMLEGTDQHERADVLVAIWDGKSRGTRSAIDAALRLGIETHVYIVT